MPRTCVIVTAGELGASLYPVRGSGESCLGRFGGMKFLSFRARGAARYGIVEGHKVVDLSARLKYPDLKALITADARAEAEREAKGATADFSLDQIVFDPVIPNAAKIVCVGL